jgi:hypothetical protein
MQPQCCPSAGRRRERVACALLPLALSLFASGCASSGVEFRPYLRAMPHKAMLTRAVSVDRRDVPALAQAGGVIIGHISAHGNGFGAFDLLEETAAVEAARRGGTHLVAETPPNAAQRETVRLELSFLVVRLADVEAMTQLSDRLQPHRGVHYQSDLVTDASERESIAPPALPSSEQSSASVRVVDGSHLKPLQAP